MMVSVHMGDENELEATQQIVSLLDSVKSIELVEGSLGTVEENAGVGAANANSNRGRLCLFQY